MNSDREGIDDSRPCGCIQDCDCDGPNFPNGNRAGKTRAGAHSILVAAGVPPDMAYAMTYPERACTCEEERSKTCPIHGFCPECSDFIEDGPCSCTLDAHDPGPSAEDWRRWAEAKAAGMENMIPVHHVTVEEARAMTRPAQQEKAFAALSSMPSAPWMQIGDLVQRLRRFGHSEQWAYDMAREWMKEHSKLVKS